MCTICGSETGILELDDGGHYWARCKRYPGHVRTVRVVTPPEVVKRVHRDPIGDSYRRQYQ